MLACRISVTVAAIAFVSVFGLAQQPRTPSSWPKDAGDDVFAPGFPEFVCGASIASQAWSPDGRYAVITRQIPPRNLKDFITSSAPEPPMTTSITVWNAGLHKPTTVWSQEGTTAVESSTPGSSFISEPQWLIGSGTAFFTVGSVGTEDGSEPARPVLWRIDARRATARVVITYDEGETFMISPTQPAAFLAGRDDEGDYLKSVSSQGDVGSPIHLGEADSGGYAAWSREGTILYRIHPTGRSSEADSSGSPATAQTGPFAYAYDVTTGKAGKLDEIPKDLYTATEPKRAVRLVKGESAVSTASAKQTIHPLWLQQGEGADLITSLIAADASDASVAPPSDAVLYITSEGAFIVPLMRIPRSEYVKVHQQAIRIKALNDVKQVALSALMYAADNDDVFPGPGADLKSVLSPYAKSDEIFGGSGGQFVYTFPGGTLHSDQNPSTTMMGYTFTDGVYFVAFMDGHAEQRLQLPEQTTAP